MMNLYLMIAILLANIISIAVVYQFIKKLEKKQTLLFIAISVAFMYILISVIYWISGFGIEKNIHEISKNFIIYLFVPVNVILFIPYLASQYMKLKLKQINIEKFINKLSILIVILIIVLIVEYFYFRNIQKNIKVVNDAQNEIMNEITNTQLEDNKNTITQNEVEINEIIYQNEMLED